jgi:two-component system, OmpR family, sensor histidine kinase BaeS
MKADVDHERLELLVHEVRSPVAALVAIAEVLENDDLGGGSLRELAHLAVAACQSVDRIVGDAALGSLHLGTLDVAMVVRDIVRAAGLEGGRVRAVVAEAIPPLLADEVRLRQALDNLVQNALVHSGSNGDVIVSATLRGDDVLLAVSDAGSGIPEAERARIFEPGTRLAEGDSGSGLGLSVVRSVVHAHGGTVEVASTPGSGATFTIALPLGDRPA